MNFKKIVSSKELTIFFLVVFSAGFQITLLRVLDFLRIITSYWESLVFPPAFFALGISFVTTPYWSNRISSLGIFGSLVAMPVCILLNLNPLVPFLYYVLMFSLGRVFGEISQNVPSTLGYSFELMGWIFGVLSTYLLFPLFGGERLYFFGSFFLACIFYFRISRSFCHKSLLILFSIFCLFDACYSFDIYQIAKEIPSKRASESNTFANAAYLLNHTNAERVKTIWTLVDRIDFIRFEGITKIFFSNKEYSFVPAYQTILNDNAESIALSGKKALVLGVGGGIDLVQLENLGYRGIVGVELLSPLISLMTSTYAPELYVRNKIINGDYRWFLRNSNPDFDLILNGTAAVVTKQSLTGFPLTNNSFSSNAYRESLRALAKDGIYLVKDIYRQNEAGVVENLVNIRVAMNDLGFDDSTQLKIFRDEKHSSFSNKSLFMVGVKKGTWNAIDFSKIQKYFGYQLLEHSSVHDEVRETLEHLLITPFDKLGSFYLSKIRYDYLAPEWKIAKDFDMRELLLAACFFFVTTCLNVLFLKQNVRFISMRSKLVFGFSGLYFGILEIVLVDRLSHFQNNPIEAFVAVFSALTLGGVFSNEYIRRSHYGGKRQPLYLAPILSLFISILFFFLLDTSIVFSQYLVALFFLFIIGFISSFNFSVCLRNQGNNKLAEAYFFNLMGLVCGLILALFVLHLSDKNFLYALWILSSFYGFWLKIFGTIVSRVIAFIQFTQDGTK